MIPVDRTPNPADALSLPLAETHRFLLAAATRLCFPGWAFVLRLSASSDDLYERISLLRMWRNGRILPHASLDPPDAWDPDDLRGRAAEALRRLRRAPAPIRALASLRRAAGLLSAEDRGACAIADAHASAIVSWESTEDATAWSLSSAQSARATPSPRDALRASGAGASLAIALSAHQRGPHALPQGSIILLSGTGPLPSETAHLRLQRQALWDALAGNPDARGALLALLADRPLVLLGTIGPEPQAVRLVATMNGTGESLLPAFLGRA
jgi:hypothetical protein